MPLPPTKFDPVVRSVSELREAHPHLYKDGDWKGPLVWERLWNTSSSDYGRFQHLTTKRMPPNGRLNGLWEAREWGTSNAEYGKEVIPRSGMDIDVPETRGANDVTRQLSPLVDVPGSQRHLPELRQIPGHRLLPPIGQK
ncbi:hypothetical protein LSAT2_029962 [Lamellibrachia satsuma]|nr:hypothetical protein LSAT2_029962 [Lamellibrachia satsuma]